ncbi:MAG TPA: DUF362 domain-containing protein [Candidatus Polarisedimenticolia bacterium]|nr:DUF362 domain-containing protein [Candidatus Polarisedimenticolia bacterium]
MQTPSVSIVRVPATAPTRDDVLAGVRRAMELAGWREFIPRGAEVSLKPNLGWDLFLPGAVTSPWALEGVVRTIRDWVGTINVVESDQVVVNVEVAFRLNRIDRVCREYDLTWVNMSRGPLHTVPLPGGRVLKELTVPEILLRTKLVTVPVIKTHNKTVITGAIKNQWGCLPMFRHNYHLVLDAALADINTVARPCFAVMDATIGLEGNSPKSGKPKVVNRVLASGDFVALDAVAARIMGFDPSRIGHLNECVAAGLGVSDLERITTTGDDDLSLNLQFVPARHNAVSWFELVLRRRAALRRIFFDTPVFRLCCKLALAYYAAWYYLLGIGRSRRDAILTTTAYGAQWRP